MRTSIKFAAIAATAVLAISGLSACSSSSSSSEPTPAGSASMVGGMTECTEAVVYAAADEAAKAMSADNVFTPDSLQCADGWAVVTGILAGAEEVAAAEANADAPQGAPTSMIFEAEGQFWIPKSAEDVCGTIDGSNYPADAQIPEALFTSGCLAG